MSYNYHCLSNVLINVAPDVVFDYLDDPHQLSSHMGKSSWMMAGSKMEIRLDDKKGRGAGAEIILEGQMMGLPLFVREFVTQSISPLKKVWETRGPQKMIVIDQYQMGFELNPSAGQSNLRIFIDYDLPRKGVNRLMGIVFGHYYAKWCVERMAIDAAKNFESKESLAARSRSTFGRRIVSASGLLIMGIGIFFIFFRPAFLPEDLKYLGIGDSPELLIPRLSLWLKRVFVVLGGFMISTGLFATGCSFIPQSRWVQLIAWITSIGLMTAVNFAIQSDFKFELLALAILWITGIVLQSSKGSAVFGLL